MISMGGVHSSMAFHGGRGGKEDVERNARANSGAKVYAWMICFRFLIPLINPLSLIIAFLSRLFFVPDGLDCAPRWGRGARAQSSSREIRFPPCSAFSFEGNNGQRAIVLRVIGPPMRNANGETVLLLGDDDYLWPIPLFLGAEMIEF